MNKIEDAVLGRVEPGDERRPGHRTLRRRGGCQPREAAAAAELR